jgi:hypothetical protein
MCLLAGCRQPAPPAPAWAVTAALVSLHPQQAAVADLDHHLALLLLQRTRLQRRPAHADPPAVVAVPAPALPALDAPSANTPPSQPYAALDAQDLEALRNALAHEQAREYARTERTLKAQSARELADTRLQLERVAETQQIGIAKAYRTARVNARLAVQSLAERKVRYPDSSRLTHDLTAAREAQGRLEREYTAKLTEAEAQMRRAILAAQASQAAQMQQVLAALRQTQREQLEQSLAQERQRLAAEALTRTPATTAPDIAFSATPADAALLPHDGLTQAAAAAKSADARRRATALATLELTRTQLLDKRRALLAQITQETEAAAIRVAERHGYVISCARPTGVNLTRDVRGWLAAYWPARN